MCGVHGIYWLFKKSVFAAYGMVPVTALVFGCHHFRYVVTELFNLFHCDLERMIMNQVSDLVEDAKNA